VSDTARQLLRELLELPEEERHEVASAILASHGPADADGDATWLAELDRRVEAAGRRGEPAPEWAEVRSRILRRMAQG
jgi:hypothetical protein